MTEKRECPNSKHKINLEKEIKENNKILAELKLDKDGHEEKEQTIEQLQTENVDLKR